jgi:hypothetical protein
MTTQPKHGEWIKCEDRLPEVREFVMTYGPELKTRWGHMIQKGWWEVLADGMERGEVTHWMPFPEPPNE